MPTSWSIAKIALKPNRRPILNPPSAKPNRSDSQRIIRIEDATTPIIAPRIVSARTAGPVEPNETSSVIAPSAFSAPFPPAALDYLGSDLVSQLLQFGANLIRIIATEAEVAFYVRVLARWNRDVRERPRAVFFGVSDLYVCAVKSYSFHLIGYLLRRKLRAFRKSNDRLDSAKEFHVRFNPAHKHGDKSRHN